MLNTQSENSHECKLRTVTSWGCVTFILFSVTWKKRREPEGKRRMRGMKRQGAEEKGRMPTLWWLWWMGVQRDSQMDCDETHQRRKWERRLVFFQGGFLCTCMHTQTLLTHTQTWTHTHIISLLLSTQLVMLTLFPHISYSVSCLCFCPLPFSITPSSFLLFYFSLAALPLHSFHFPFSPCLLHSPLPFSSVPISVSPSPPPLQSPSVALVRTQTGTKGKETSLGVALILLTLTWQH